MKGEMLTKTILTTMKVKLYPNNEQRELLNKQLGTTRWLWNYMLAHMLNEGYKTAFELNMLLPILKQEYPWLKLIDAQSLQQTNAKLAQSVKMYFKHKRTGKPKFKSKQDNNDYFIIPQRWRLIGNKITIPKIGLVKISHMSKNIIDILEYKQVIIKKDADNNYTASMVIEAIITLPDDGINDTIGIDVNTSNLLADSEGKIIEAMHKHPKIKKIYNRIRQAKRSLSKKIIGSKSYISLRYYIAKLFYKITKIKKDSIHKISYKYSKYKNINMEKLNIKKMTRNTSRTVDAPNPDAKRKSNLNRAILGNNWYSLMIHIKYKAERLGNLLTLVDPYMTSQMCSRCGNVDKLNRKSQSDFICTSCGLTINADYNAAINIAGKQIV